jgi:hypothetical protein
MPVWPVKLSPTKSRLVQPNQAVLEKKNIFSGLGGFESAPSVVSNKK